jgi:hypothetical protein
MSRIDRQASAGAFRPHRINPVQAMDHPGHTGLAELCIFLAGVVFY